MSKRAVSSILCILMLLAMFIGCANTETESNTSEPTAESTAGTEAQLYPDLPEVTYDGYNYRIYLSDVFDYRTWEDIWVEESGSEPISAAVYNRNLAIYEKYDITISTATDEYLTYESNLVKNVLANDDFADLMVSLGDDICRLYTKDVFYNLRNVPYLEFDKPWWDAKAADSFTLGGYMPFGISDLTINDKGVTGVMYFNKQLASDLSVGDLYQLIKDGNWNFDKMVELGKLAEYDNGDAVLDDSDRYGILGDDGMVYQLFAAGGARHISKNDEGMPELTFNTETNVSMIKDYLDNILFVSSLTYNSSGSEKGGLYSDTMFTNNQGLFLMRPLNSTEKFRSTMESDFGILPLPKYSDSQESYYSPVQCYGGSVISIPLNVSDVERSGIILEALSAESTYTLIPAFYDIVLKNKNTRDEESKEMLDIILATRVYDVGVFYSLAGFSNEFVLITGKQKSIFGIPQTSDVASFYAKREKKLLAALDDLYTIIDEGNSN